MIIEKKKENKEEKKKEIYSEKKKESWGGVGIHMYLTHQNISLSPPHLLYFTQYLWPVAPLIISGYKPQRQQQVKMLKQRMGEEKEKRDP